MKNKCIVKKRYFNNFIREFNGDSTISKVGGTLGPM